jgi:hypothetical protein
MEHQTFTIQDTSEIAIHRHPDTARNRQDTKMDAREIRKTNE